MRIKHFAASDVTYYCTSQNSKPKEEAQDPESTLAGLLVLLRIIGPEASKTSVHPSFSTKEGCLCASGTKDTEAIQLPCRHSDGVTQWVAASQMPSPEA